jgi:hypothetical protein
MIFSSLVLLALTLFVAWDSSEGANQARLSDSPGQSNRRKLWSARRPWSWVQPTVARRTAPSATNPGRRQPMVLMPRAHPSLRHTVRILRTPALGGWKIWNLSVSDGPSDERSKA